MSITHTAGQVLGYQKFAQFYMDPMETVMLLKGYSGTGKSTLVQHMIAELPKLNSMIQLIDPNFVPYEVVLTATTNQAAEALAFASGIPNTMTIHSKLGLRVDRDFQTGKTKLIISNGAPKAVRCLLFIDEASYIDQHTLSLIFEQVENCKIIFIGDPGQLTPVMSSYMPAFNMDKNQIELTEAVRQNEDSPLRPIIEGLRKAVFYNVFPKIKLTPGVVEWRNQQDFEAEAFNVFNQPDAPSTKILAYTNDKVTYYNNLLSTQILGSSVPLVGQKMIVNSMVTNRSSTCKTQEEVMLESVKPTTEYGVPGYEVKLHKKAGWYFLPKTLGLWKARYKQAQKEEDFIAMETIDLRWIDLRPSFACTINKSQGSTYHTIFIDLNDVSVVRTGNALARYLYVGLSRASHRVVMTGDLIKR